MSDAVKIVVDAGERSCGIETALRGLGAIAVIERLDVADYLVAHRIGVERKAVPDLHRSIASGRIWTQLLACRRRLDRTYLLVEGARLDAGHISQAGVRGALLEIADRGVTVIRSEDADDSALWLFRLARRYQRRHPRPRYRPKYEGRVVSPQMVLERIPGIGPRTARSLLGQFGSVRGVAEADLDSLGQVVGVGPRRAAALRQLLSDS